MVLRSKFIAALKTKMDIPRAQKSVTSSPDSSHLFLRKAGTEQVRRVPRASTRVQTWVPSEASVGRWFFTLLCKRVLSQFWFQSVLGKKTAAAKKNVI